MSEVNRKISVNIEKLKDYSIADTRFTTVKIWLMHLGKNLNGSKFNKESVTKAIPSLSNTPILGYIQENENGDNDFSDHRIGLEVKDKEIKVKYKGMAFGVIPESNDATFEKKVCDDGIEREFLTCKGLIWRKFEDADDILARDNSKDESMELADSYTGSFDEDGYFEFDEFMFDGACMLGCSVQPAMTGACVNIQFSIDEIKTKLEQFNTYINNQSSENTDVDNTNYSEKGGTTLAEEIKNEEVVEDTTVDTEEVIEEIKPEVDEPVADEHTEEETANTNESSDSDDNTVTETTETEFSNSTNFSTTYRQKREALSSALVGSIERDSNGDIISSTDYWLEDFDEKYVYVEKYTWSNGDGSSENGRLSYTFNEETMTATVNSDFEKMIVTWVTIEENERLKAERTEYARLVQFEKDTLSDKRDIELKEMFSTFDEKLSDVEAYSKLKENCADMSIEDIEDKCFALVGKLTTKFSTKKKEEKVVKLDFEVSEPDDTDDGYGGILSSKYGK